MTEKVSTEKTEKSKPRVKDEFLADLIREFGAEYGVELYQAGNVTKEDLAGFTTLREKFGVEVKPHYKTVYREHQAGMVGVPPTQPRRRFGTSPD